MQIEFSPPTLLPSVRLTILYREFQELIPERYGTLIIASWLSSHDADLNGHDSELEHQIAQSQISLCKMQKMDHYVQTV